jgi:hypothetical protein
MTTERRQSNRAVLRLYVVAALAAVYTISWRAIGGHAPAAEPSSASVPTASEPRRFVTAPTRVVREPVRRVPRVRTRSS